MNPIAVTAVQAMVAPVVLITAAAILSAARSIIISTGAIDYEVQRTLSLGS